MQANHAKHPVNFFDHTVEELSGLFEEAFEGRKFRAEIIHKWVYQKGVIDIDQMSNLSKPLRDKLKGALSFDLPNITEAFQSTDGSYKFLQQLADGYEIETVVVNNGDHYCVCVSSQVGCAMECKFCMTGKMGLKRNLKVHEIVGQIYNAYFFLAEKENRTLRNIVYMGMGEPFHNYIRVTKSLKILMDMRGFNFGNRRVTVSTSGLIPQIERFLQEETANLAISLNAADQLRRQELMPVAVKHTLENLIDVCKKYSAGLRKRITFEYIMIKGVNDSLADAGKLAKLLRGVKGKINLIPYNMNDGLNFERSEETTLKVFQQFLHHQGYVVTVRYSKGQDIAAACGQLISLKKSA